LGNDGFKIDIQQVDDFAFQVDFGMEGVSSLLLDEPEPIGNSNGPNPSRVLAASVGTCLSASLLFCMRKAKVEVNGISTRVHTLLTRNEQGRLRIGEMKIAIEVDSNTGEEKGIARCAKIFKDYCVVTESVKNGIPVEVEVRGKEEYRATNSNPS
jgi:uncharacterized OsmC-like protein